jgi:hypothetical protein
MTIIKTNSDARRNIVELTSSCDLSHPDQATTLHDGAFGWVLDFPLNLNGLISLRFRRDLKCFPHVPELPSEDLHYHMRRIPVQVNHLSIFNI